MALRVRALQSQHHNLLLLLRSSSSSPARSNSSTIRASMNSGCVSKQGNRASYQLHHKIFNHQQTIITPITTDNNNNKKKKSININIIGEVKETAIENLERLLIQHSHYFDDDRHNGMAGGNLSDYYFSVERRRLRVAYQGVQGSYSQEAAERTFPPSTTDAFACGPNMEDTFTALRDRSADRAIVPAENSLDGPLHRNLDLLLRYPDVSIVGELVVPVNHCLLAMHGVELPDIRRVVGHPQALSHCSSRLLSLDHIQVEEVPCAAAAARVLAEEKIPDIAVIGSAAAAREFGLRILDDNFQKDSGAADARPNVNRFLQLGLFGKSAAAAGMSYYSTGSPTATSRKTTVAFTLEKGIGELWQALQCFERRGVKLMRLDHRPNRRRPVIKLREGEHDDDEEGCRSCMMQMDYVFVVEMEGSTTDSNVADGLTKLTELATYVRIVGSYTTTA